MRGAAKLALAQGLAALAAAASVQPVFGRAATQSYANPSAVIAAEIALGHAAREKGQWQALRKAAAPGAILFAPRPAQADEWLKRRDEPGAAVRWQPGVVWMSCDGRLAVSRGVVSGGDVRKSYVAVWHRVKRDDWKWLLREEATAGADEAAPDMIAGKVAECAGLRQPDDDDDDDDSGTPLIDPGGLSGASRDGSLRWRVQVAPDCSRTIAVRAWNGSDLMPVYEIRRAAPRGGCD